MFGNKRSYHLALTHFVASCFCDQGGLLLCAILQWLSVKQGTGNRGTEQGTERETRKPGT